MTELKQQLDQITSFVEKVLSKKPEFYGNIRLNFQKGALVNVNIQETVAMRKPSKAEAMAAEDAELTAYVRNKQGTND